MSEGQLRQLSIAVGHKLKEHGAWVTCAESCTGGWVAKALTDIAGSSAYFDRGLSPTAMRQSKIYWAYLNDLSALWCGE